MIDRFGGLIHKCAVSFSVGSELSTKELEQHGVMLVLNAVATWDPSKGPLPRRVKYKLYTGVRDYVKKQNTYTYLPFDDSHACSPPSALRLVLFKEAISHLSQDAKEALKTLIEEVDTLGPPVEVRGELRRLLTKKKFSYRRVWGCFAELKQLARSPI